MPYFLFFILVTHSRVVYHVGDKASDYVCTDRDPVQASVMFLNTNDLQSLSRAHFSFNSSSVYINSASMCSLCTKVVYLKYTQLNDPFSRINDNSSTFNSLLLILDGSSEHCAHF